MNKTDYDGIEIGIALSKEMKKGMEASRKRVGTTFPVSQSIDTRKRDVIKEALKDTEIVFVDPKGESSKTLKELGGVEMKLSDEPTVSFNPFNTFLKSAEGKSTYRKSQIIKMLENNKDILREKKN